MPYIVAGAAGYANDARSMHKLQKDLRIEFKKGTKLPYKTTANGVVLQSYQEEEPGFLRITASKREVLFEYFIVPFSGGPVKLFDSVTA